MKYLLKIINKIYKFTQQISRKMQELFTKFFLRKSDTVRSSALSNLVKNGVVIIPPCLFVAWQTSDLFLRLFCCALTLIILVYYLKSHEYLLKKDPRWLCSEDYLIQDKYLDVAAKQGNIPRLISPFDPLEQPKPSLLKERDNE